MPYIDKTTTQKILDLSEGKLLQVLEHNMTLYKKGASYKGQCPNCETEKGLEYHDEKKIFKCFRCGFGGNSPVSFYMKQGKSYPEALELLARQFSVLIEEPKSNTPKKTSKKTKSYCSRMLSESGLTEKDVQAKTFRSDENKTTTIGKVFKSGTINSKNQIVDDGDDVIIEYYDLEGLPVKYEKKAKGNEKPLTLEYFRVRWQFPEEHLSSTGKPQKYKSPPGSSPFIFFPQKIREMYKQQKKISRLFVQEGEKKAEKACKHDIPSVAISGIQNFGIKGKLHEDFVKLVDVCKVEEIVLLFDADWNDLSSSLDLKNSVDKRPRNFFYAARNFKDYCITLKNSRNIYVDVYIGNIQPNEKKDKGIDDLLANTLKGDEKKLLDEIDFLFNEKEKIGKYVQFHKITSWSDGKLMELWHLQSVAVFAEAHKESLQNLPEFKIGKHTWRFSENGLLESAQPIEEYEQFWEEVPKENKFGEVVSMSYKFRYERCFRFLQNRGFYNYIRKDGEFELIRVQHPIIEVIPRYEFVRNFVKDFAREVCVEEVLEMLHRGGPQFLGPEKLTNLKILEPNFEKPQRQRQLLYFNEYYWEITADNIKEKNYTEIEHQIWSDQKRKIPVKRTPRLINVVKTDNNFDYTISDTGKKCDFLIFLENTSNFTWRKEKNKSNTIGTTEEKHIHPKEITENKKHLISKLCAIGYMVLSAKDGNVAKAVIAMDGRQSEVGQSNGRSGKSLVGELFRNISSIAYVDGKKDFRTDQFLWNDVTEKTRTVFIDDVRPSFDFEQLFPQVTGSWNVNYKGGGRAVLEFEYSPKIYLTTNHALNGEGSSFHDRQWKIAFSDYYNDNHKPTHDFGSLFFSEWDFEQWNYCWNLIAECVQLYLKYGVVEAPQERIVKRELRQAMGEVFLSWAEKYFHENINKRIIKEEMYNNFLTDNPEQRKWVKPTTFKKKLRKYCEYKDYIFNPNKYDYSTGLCMFFDNDGRPNDMDKSGGVEYVTIGDKKSWQKGDFEDKRPF